MIPIIFASAVINLPVLLSQVLPSDGWGASVSKFINDYLADTDQPGLPGVSSACSSSVLACYTAIAFDPVQQADNLRKQGGFIPASDPDRRPSTT